MKHCKSWEFIGINHDEPSIVYTHLPSIYQLVQDFHPKIWDGTSRWQAPKLNQRQVVSQRHRGATLCNPGTWDTSNFPMDFFGMFWSSGSNPLGGHQCLRRQEQQVRPGLQQGAGGLRHLPRLHHRGARTGSGREWPLGTGECWRARGTKKVGETCNGFEFLQSLWYIMMRREI